MTIDANIFRCVSRAPVRALTVLAAVGWLAAPSVATAQDDIVCESSGGQYRTCRADTRDGVILLTQLSGAGCHQGSTWGFDDRSIWVSNGCRAVFRTGHSDYGYVRDHGRSDGNAPSAGAAIAGIALALGAAAAIKDARDDADDYSSHEYHNYNNYRHRTFEVTCESQNNSYRECRANIGRGGEVHMTRRMSSSGCQFNRDWGFDRNSIWVDNGCRARFEVEQ